MEATDGVAGLRVVRFILIAAGLFALGLPIGVGLKNADGMWVNDFIRATAEILKAVAWPFVVLAIVIRHRGRVDNLLFRLREGPGGAKFYPPTPTQSPDANDPVEELQQVASAIGQPAPTGSGTSAGGQDEALPAVIVNLRTSVAVLEAEQQILEADELKSLRTAAARERALSTVAAGMFVATRFERIESLIWASQIETLEYLNADGPAEREVIKSRFYDPAAAKFPDTFTTYPFEAYVNFLVSFGLIQLSDFWGVTIADFGREYLIWRLRDGRSKKSFG